MHSINTTLAPELRTAPLASAARTALVETDRHGSLAIEQTAPAAVPSIIREENRLRTTDGLGITCVIALSATVAMGWLDAAIPSGLAISVLAIRGALVPRLTTRRGLAVGRGGG
jgi:hypothetical protein